MEPTSPPNSLIDELDFSQCTNLSFMSENALADIDSSPSIHSRNQNSTSSVRLRNYCFTLNNPTPGEITFLHSTLPQHTDCRFLVFQIESGESGTVHIQGYVEWRKQIRVGTLRRISPFQRAHLEARRGTQAQAIAYCKKEESRLEGPYEYGTPAIESQGARKDLEEIKTKIDSGEPIAKIWDEHFGTMVRYNRGINVYKSIVTKPRTWKTEVKVLWGEPGTGKSRWCADTYPYAYWKQRGLWWDNYDGHEVVVMDDFYGWLPYDTLLRLLDRYPLLVETKGGQVNFVAKIICITSNKLPNEWYPNMPNWDALKRRIDKFFLFNDTINEYNTYEELFN